MMSIEVREELKNLSKIFRQPEHRILKLINSLGFERAMAYLNESKPNRFVADDTTWLKTIIASDTQNLLGAK
jgi:hypothetical protein